MSRRIDTAYLPRVEGETAIRIELDDQRPVELRIFEPPRFFEGFLVGRKYDEVGDLVSRICGICPVSHMTTAILAIEKAMHIQVSEQTTVLRKIMSISQIVASHLIHLYMLAMPDYHGRASMVEMLPDHNDTIQRLLEMKKVMNELTALIGGRALHPVTHMPGGFTCIPQKKDCDALLPKLERISDTARSVINDFAQLTYPDFYSDSEYVALDDGATYSFTSGRIVSTRGLDIPVDHYGDSFTETEVPYAAAKRSTVNGRGSFMVGALARLHIKYGRLREETRRLAKTAGLKLPVKNPFYNNAAQALEVFDGIRQCISLIKALECHDEDRIMRISDGEGGAMTEAPRGLLYHWYRLNPQGVVESAEIVTPTSHNFFNIENDLRKLVDENRHMSRAELRLLCEELIRAYDPCFSCSVH